MMSKTEIHTATLMAIGFDIGKAVPYPVGPGDDGTITFAGRSGG